MRLDAHANAAFGPGFASQLSADLYQAEMLTAETRRGEQAPNSRKVQKADPSPSVAPSSIQEIASANPEILLDRARDDAP
jgi:hypothetical protein